MHPDGPPKIRLFTNQPLAAGGAVTLAGEQVHYLRNVMRAQPGGAVGLFNGRDGEWRGEIETLAKQSAMVALLEQVRPQEPRPPAELLFAGVKRAAADLIAEKATELGAGALQPVITARTNVARVNTDRLQKIVREAAEQCGRTSLPEVRAPKALIDVLAAWPAAKPLLHFDETGGGRRVLELGGVLGQGTNGFGILIGPEGGFDVSELDALANLTFVTPVTLGKAILRAETAALAALACCRAVLDGTQS